VTLKPAHPVLARQAELTHEVPWGLSLAIHSELAAVETEWRGFERIAECTAFQTFDWLATWQRHIGQSEGVRPVIAVGTFTDGDTAFILPLAVQPQRFARKLCWLGQDWCDYTAPLLARDFSQRITPDRFRAIWHELRQRMQRDAPTRHNWIDLEKMPCKVGSQINPFTYLDVSTNASGAHLTRLCDNWEKFYFEKRSSATRRHDRAKRRHMSEFGEVRFVHSADPDDARRMVEILVQQKSRSLASKGLVDIFARPGSREFLIDLASNPATRHLIHVSGVEIGTTWAALNFGIVFGDCYYHMLASYDDGEVSRYGPGALHLRELMAYAIGRGLRRFDFTIGDEPYKLDWSDTHLKLCDYAAAATWRGWPASFWSNARRRLKRFVKQSPSVWRFVCSFRSAIGLFQTRPQ
jgi:CelD/BcsL family acetyltransferase involved in cellulose biosynthesis